MSRHSKGPKGRGLRSLRGEVGFTIVELMIATAVFSLVLMLLAGAVVTVGRIYYKGAITNRLQDTSRGVIDEVVQSVQFSAKGAGYKHDVRTDAMGTTESYCIGTVRYTFNKSRSLGSEASQIKHVLWRDYVGEDDPCEPAILNPASGDPSPGGQELVGDNMRVAAFTVCNSNDAGCGVLSGTWKVSIVIAYGQTDDVFEPASNFQTCVGQRSGGQFCAVSSISTEVAKRL